jgi:hypothetical protein
MPIIHRLQIRQIQAYWLALAVQLLDGAALLNP